MKTLRIGLLIATFVAAILPALADDSEAAKKDLAKLQGEWEMVSGSGDGQPMPAEMLARMKRVCTNDSVTITMGEQVFFKAKFALDAAKKPKAIDYDMTAGPTKGQKQLGIYEFEGETVKFCFAKPGESRPTEFKPGIGLTYSVWKKSKEAKAPEKK